MIPARRRGVVQAWSLAAVTCLASIAAVVLGLLSGRDARPAETGAIWEIFVVFAGAATLSIVGAFVVTRHPYNPVGWITCTVGLSVALARFCVEYATYVVLAKPGALPGGQAMVWLSEWIWAPAMMVGTFLLLLFPSGRLPSRRWRPVAWLAAAGMLGVTVHEAFSPGSLDEFPRENPFALGGAGGQFAEAVGPAYSLINIATIACVASLVIRMRRARGDERQQLKWLAVGGTVFVVGVVLSNLPGTPRLPLLLGHVAVASAVGVGILRYRLYDIDVAINRTLVYGSLSATLAGAYLASVLVLQFVLSGMTSGSGVAVAGSTLAVAALFAPARRRIQAVVDRRFYRSRYDAARTLQRFGAQLRDEVDLDALGDDLCAVVARTMQPAHVSLWLRVRE